MSSKLQESLPKLVDWLNFMPKGTRVIYSNLCNPDVERDDLNKNIAEIILPNDIYLDIEFIYGRYWIHIYKEYDSSKTLEEKIRFDESNYLCNHYANTSENLINLILRIVDDYYFNVKEIK